jgi:hypothetical protein
VLERHIAAEYCDDAARRRHERAREPLLLESLRFRNLVLVTQHEHRDWTGRRAHDEMRRLVTAKAADQRERHVEVVRRKPYTGATEHIPHVLRI